MAPEIETARLRLRGLRASDEPHFTAMHEDMEVVRYLGGKPFPREDCFRRIAQCAGLWTLLGYGYWGIERRSDDRFIGILGFADFKRDMDPSIEGLPEMGWILSREGHGQGFASEGVAAGLEWADATLKSEVTAIIDPANQASIRVAEKAGFSDRSEATYKGASILLFRRPAPGAVL